MREGEMAELLPNAAFYTQLSPLAREHLPPVQWSQGPLPGIQQAAQLCVQQR